MSNTTLDFIKNYGRTTAEMVASKHECWEFRPGWCVICQKEYRKPRLIPAWMVPGASQPIVYFGVHERPGDHTNVILPGGKVVNYLTPVLA